MVISGNKKTASGYFEGLDLLASMRLCPNMLSQLGIKAALDDAESIGPLLLPNGRLLEQRDITVEMVNKIPGLSVVKPKGSLYCFPKIDTQRFNIKSDEQFVMDFLRDYQVLFVHGTGFNWKAPDHFRIVFLPDKAMLSDALGRLGKFLENYRQS